MDDSAEKILFYGQEQWTRKIIANFSDIKKLHINFSKNKNIHSIYNIFFQYVN